MAEKKQIWVTGVMINPSYKEVVTQLWLHV